jgi:hypothetical protein
VTASNAGVWKSQGMARFLGAPGLSLASQVMGLLQLVALLWRYGASNATDAYFYLFNLGNLPTQILIVGVLYPVLINDDRVTRRRAAQFGVWVPVTALLAVAAGAGFLGLTGRVSIELAPVIVLSSINAVIQARLWFYAVIAAAGGVPHWIAAIALPANFLATVTLVIPWGSSLASVTAMMLSLTLANAVFLIATVRSRASVGVIQQLPETSATRSFTHLWFVAKSATSYGGLMIVQSLALTLPPATLTLLTLPMKVVASVSATFVNAVMPILVHQTTDSPAAARRFLRILVLLLGAVGAAGVAGAALLAPEYFLEVLIVALWLVASAASSVAGRLAYRFLKPSASRITIVIVPVIVVAVAVSTLSPSFGLLALLCAYAAVDAASSFLLLAALRDRVMAGLCAILTLGLALIWGWSLMP